MRKRAFTILIAGLLWGNFGCSHTQPNQAPIASQTSGSKNYFDASSAQGGMGKTAAEQTFTPGGVADGGVVVQSQQMGRGSLDNAGMGMTSAAPGYVNEVESTNYRVAQNKTRVSGSTDPGRIYEKGIDEDGQAYTRSVEKSPDLTSYTSAMTEPLSTFSADVDTAAYTNLRRSLFDGQKPYPEQIRVEEMVNYFSYNLPEPKKGQPFSVTSELSECPWKPEAKLLRLAIKTKSIPRGKRPACNLVFLLDVSGSMGASDKLPLLKSSLKTLVDSLDDNDRIAIVTYAGSSGLVLPSTTADKKTVILDAIDRLAAGGSTNGASGIELAYKVAQDNVSGDSVNRVILATDGDFNVGVSTQDGLKKMIEEKRKSGLFLSVLGFGGSAGGDKTMETLADQGNGNYANIDSLREARKVLVEESGANLVTVAKDVKFQIAFNPRQVEKYRLIGYENRRLTTQDFSDDRKDAGDLGAGHSVTVLYELIPPKKKVDVVKMVLDEAAGNQPSANQLALVKLRYKAPGDDASDLIEIPVMPDDEPLSESSPDHRWAVAVTEFGMALKGDSEVKDVSFDEISTLAESGIAKAGDPYRLEFLEMVAKAKALAG